MTILRQIATNDYIGMFGINHRAQLAPTSTARTKHVKNSVDAGMKRPTDRVTGETSQGVNACR